MPTLDMQNISGDTLANWAIRNSWITHVSPQRWLDDTFDGSCEPSKIGSFGMQRWQPGCVALVWPKYLSWGLYITAGARRPVITEKPMTRHTYKGCKKSEKAHGMRILEVSHWDYEFDAEKLQSQNMFEDGFYRILDFKVLNSIRGASEMTVYVNK